MKRALTLVTTASALLILAGGTASAECATVPSYRQWQVETKVATEPVIPWLESRVQQGGTRLAIVLDIDNTALETHFHPGQATRPVREVAQWAAAHQVSVLFVTWRPESDRASTVAQLQAAGYPVDGLCMKTTGVETKPRCRQALTAEGFTITANIGNRWTDFDRGNYERSFKLPDYCGRLE